MQAQTIIRGIIKTKTRARNSFGDRFWEEAHVRLRTKL